MPAILTSIIEQICTEIVDGTDVAVAVDGFLDKDPKADPRAFVIVENYSQLDIEINNTFDITGSVVIIVEAGKVDPCRELIEAIAPLFMPGPSDELNALGVLNMQLEGIDLPMPMSDTKQGYQGAVRYNISIRFTYT